MVIFCLDGVFVFSGFSRVFLLVGFKTCGVLTLIRRPLEEAAGVASPVEASGGPRRERLPTRPPCVATAAPSRLDSMDDSMDGPFYTAI